MRITYVWDGDYPWDIRADKVCTSLIEAGHEVHIACRNKGRQAREDSYHGAQIRRLPYLPAWTGSLNGAISFPAFFSPLWIWHIWRVARRSDAELIIVRDLPMALAAILVAKMLGVPCVLDMAECYPEMLRCTWQFEGPSLRNYLLRNPKLADAVERAVLKRIDGVWVMVEESRDRLLAMGVPASKIRIVSNYPVHERFTLAPAPEGADASRLRIVYVGLLNPSRGLDTTIEAVSRFAMTDPAIELVVAGSGKADARLRALVDELNVAEYVRFLGWVDNEEVPRLLAESHVGIVPHHKCSHWDTTIPNKLFDYMAAGIPVIVSNVTPMKRVVEETGCGLVYMDDDVDTLVDVLRRLKDPELRRAQAEAGREAVERRYNWATEERILLQAVDGLAS